ncbi:MAG TPA: histidine phosphatase family protein, partial [Acetobacteraceae bacterium]|nr:histidine phosphatase family protein [Acetobacteraceae bacterium]
DLGARAVAAVNRATAKPGPVLVVAHGALFRALRGALGHKPNVRTPNALPIWCAPPAEGPVWAITPVELPPLPA